MDEPGAVEAARRAVRLREFERQTDLPMLLLSVAYIGLLVGPILAPVLRDHQPTLDAVEWLVWGVFTAEFGTRVVLAPARVRYVASHWYDVVIVLVPFLRPLRALRLLRLVGLAARGTMTIRRILIRHGLGYALAVGVLVTVLAAAAVQQAEQDSERASIIDFPSALWWAVTTITTVGYGDTYPVSPVGRGVGVLLMLVGISLFGVITAGIAAYFVHEDAGRDPVLEALTRIEGRLDRLERRAQGSSPVAPERGADGEESR